ncbi:MAG: binding-protein-dependent transport system inner rane component [Clostridiales bacterium]|jgi:putative aldouronate transport system permease protein|nr:binding-protein-dependent transport system inner rane component [Clostridiales bacterium]
MSKTLASAVSPSKGFAKKKKTLLLLTMVMPGAIWLILLRYLPMFGVVIAFKDYKIFSKAPSLFNNVIHSDWVGLDNFKFLFMSTDSWNMIRNTIGYNALWIALGLVISVAFAIMLNEISNKFVAKSYQTLMFFPYFLSWVVASYFLLAFLDQTRGLLPNIQKDLGMEVTSWYSDAKPWPIILTISNLWKNIGYSTILYLAAITGIDASQYEAASIDGASKWQQIRYVTIPHLKPMIIILLIMNVGKIVNSDFGLFYTLPQNSGPLYQATQVIDTYVYRVLMTTNAPGMSTAASLLQNLVGFICIMTLNSIVRKMDKDNSLF